MSLNVIDLITQVERILHEVLALRFQKRLEPVRDVAALMQSPTSVVKDFDLRYVEREGVCYRFEAHCPLPAEGVTVIQPQDRPALGRWRRVISPVTKGPNQNKLLRCIQDPAEAYCKQVLLHMAEDGSQREGLERGFGQTPSLLLEWLGDAPEARSHLPGALYHNPVTFQIIVLSECLRRGPWAQWGSPVPREAAADPGLNAMIGQVRHLLAGADLHMPGIESVEIGRASKVHEDLDQRMFAASMQLTVRTNFSIPDEDLLDPLLWQVTEKDLGPWTGV